MTSAGVTPPPNTGFVSSSIGAVDGGVASAVLNVLATPSGPDLAISGSTATLSTGVAEGHLLIPGVLPGRSALAADIPANCSLACARSLPSEVWVEESAVSYVDLGDCSIPCVD